MADGRTGVTAYRQGMNAIGHLRRIPGRHPCLADAMIAMAVFAATVSTTFSGPTSAVGDRTVAIVSAVLACGSLCGRRRSPMASLAVSAVAAEVFLVQTSDTTGVLILLAPVIAIYTVADLVERRYGLLLGGSAVAALALVHAAHRPVLLGPQNLAFVALGGLAIAAGDSARNRRAYLAELQQRAERAEWEREQDARHRVAEERLRIARDLHDSVGHHLALIGVQSDVAGRAIDSDALAAREALAHVKFASRRALEQLRDTISLLRQPDEPVAPTAIPTPGLDGLEPLLASLRTSGMDIDSRVDGAVVPLAPAVDLTAYRVIQESLTNVYKHSNQRQARLTLRYGRRELRITVDDPGCGSTTGGLPAGRHGIVGMRERVFALGGHFTAGPRPDSGFRVAADLPYHPAGLTAECAP